MASSLSNEILVKAEVGKGGWTSIPSTGDRDSPSHFVFLITEPGTGGSLVFQSCVLSNISIKGVDNLCCPPSAPNCIPSFL